MAIQGTGTYVYVFSIDFQYGSSCDVNSVIGLTKCGNLENWYTFICIQCHNIWFRHQFSIWFQPWCSLCNLEAALSHYSICTSLRSCFGGPYWSKYNDYYQKWYRWNHTRIWHIIHCQDQFFMEIQDLKSEFQYSVCGIWYGLLFAYQWCKWSIQP